MFRSRWIHQLLILHGSRNLRRRQVTPTHKPVPLILETLEERVTPNATVTQSAGSYTQLTSLVASDTATNTNYVINITNNFTYTAGGQVAISTLGTGSTLTIQGQNGTNFTLTGNGNRLFAVAPGQNVTLDNLTLTGGSGVEDGGAILDDGGNVALSRMTVTSNTATGSPARGGGVFVAGGALGAGLTIKNSTIANNVAQGLDGVSGSPNGGNAEGGGVFVSGLSFVQITNSTLSNNRALGGAGANVTTPGANGGNGGSADGGGLFALGNGWGVTLTGDTFSGNAALGAIGGNGAAGVNAINPNSTGGTGGKGGIGGSANGGGVYASGNGVLTILNDLTAPLAGPSLFINNTATGTAGGVGGAGGKSTGSAKNANGGAGGVGGSDFGGGVFLSNSGTSTVANTTFFGNSANGSNGGVGGAAGTGGTGGAGSKGSPGQGGGALGGGLFVNLGTFTMLNSTVAKNTGTNGNGNEAFGGGVWQSHAASALYDNNTITQNSVTGGSGAGMAIDFSTPSLYNNLIQGNILVGFGEDDLDTAGGVPNPLPNATNNFVSASFSSPNAVNPATNIVGNLTPQLGTTVGVSGGHASGGPIYYPLLSGATSIGAGTPTVLGTITTVEGTTPATDEIGDLRTSNGTASGSLSLGAVQPLALEAPIQTTVVPGNAGINFYGTNPAPAFQVAVGVNSSFGGAASGGILSISLVSDNTTTPLGTALVDANGTAVVNVPAGSLPANLAPGAYELVESYSGDGSFTSSTALGTLMVTLAPTTVVAGNASLNYFGATSPVFTITAAVNSPAGTVNGGSLSISLVANNTTTPIGSAAVTNGTATITVLGATLPSNLATGSYQLIESYSGSPPFVNSSADGTLSITTTPTSVVAGNASVNIHSPGVFTVAVAVNSPSGTVNSGTVTISLVSGNTITNLTPTPVSVSAGVAHVSVAPALLPSNLATGTYQLLESYVPATGGPFAGSTANGTLTVEPTSTPSTSVIPGNSSIGSTGGATTIAVGVNSPVGLVNVGTLTISLVNGGSTTVLGSAPVSGNSASVPVSIPSGLAPGNYQLVETYADTSGNFGGSSALGTLAVFQTPPPPPPQVAALKVALDAAALALQSNPIALMELDMISQLFLDLTLPNSFSGLVGEIQFLYPYTDGLGLDAFYSGIIIAEALSNS